MQIRRKMDLRKARGILNNIHDEETDVEDKLTAIQEELDADKHRAITKESLIEVLRWVIEEYI